MAGNQDAAKAGLLEALQKTDGELEEELIPDEGDEGEEGDEPEEELGKQILLKWDFDKGAPPETSEDEGYGPEEEELAQGEGDERDDLEELTLAIDKGLATQEEEYLTKEWEAIKDLDKCASYKNPDGTYRRGWEDPAITLAARPIVVINTEARYNQTAIKSESKGESEVTQDQDIPANLIQTTPAVSRTPKTRELGIKDDHALITLEDARRRKQAVYERTHNQFPSDAQPQDKNPLPSGWSKQQHRKHSEKFQSKLRRDARSRKESQGYSTDPEESNEGARWRDEFTHNEANQNSKPPATPAPLSVAADAGSESDSIPLESPAASKLPRALESDKEHEPSELSLYEGDEGEESEKEYESDENLKRTEPLRIFNSSAPVAMIFSESSEPLASKPGTPPPPFSTTTSSSISTAGLSSTALPQVNDSEGLVISFDALKNKESFRNAINDELTKKGLKDKDDEGCSIS